MVGRTTYLPWFRPVLLDIDACSLLLKCTSPTNCPYTHSDDIFKSWKLAYFPISGNVPYDKFGLVYNISRVLTIDDRFDLAAYNDYSPLFLPATYAVTYLIAFALSTCVIVHTLLYHGRSLLNGIKKLKVERDDIHAKLMRNYPEVPDWWYLCALCVFFGLAVVAVEVGIWCTCITVGVDCFSLFVRCVGLGH